MSIPVPTADRIYRRFNGGYEIFNSDGSLYERGLRTSSGFQQFLSAVAGAFRNIVVDVGFSFINGRFQEKVRFSSMQAYLSGGIPYSGTTVTVSSILINGEEILSAPVDLNGDGSASDLPLAIDTSNPVTILANSRLVVTHTEPDPPPPLGTATSVNLKFVS